jgi:hypothetical protein
MGDWGLIAGSGPLYSGGLAASTRLTAVASHSTNANAKGSDVVIIPSTPFAGTLIVTLYSETATKYGLVDIKVGSQVIAANLLFTMYGAAYHAVKYYLPIVVPAGSVINAAWQSTVANQTVYVGVQIMPTAFTGPAPYNYIETLGADLSDSGGTQVVTGKSSVKGSWVNVGTPLAHDSKAIIVAWGTQGLSSNGFRAYLDIGAGSAVLIPDIYLHHEGGAAMMPPEHLPLAVAAGTQLQLRVQFQAASITTEPDFVLYAIS